MASFKVSGAHEKFIRTFTKSRGLDSAEEGLEKILNIAQSRLKALSNYAEATGGKSKKSKKTAKKAGKAKAAAKPKAKAKAKSKAAPKTRKASATKKSSGVPKGFSNKPTNSAPEPAATEATAATA